MKISDLTCADFRVGERVEVSWGGWTDAPKTVDGMNRATVMQINAGGFYTNIMYVLFDGETEWRPTEPYFVRKLCILDELVS